MEDHNKDQQSSQDCSQHSHVGYRLPTALSQDDVLTNFSEKVMCRFYTALLILQGAMSLMKREYARLQMH